MKESITTKEIWKVRPCRRCGGEARYPAHFLRQIKHMARVMEQVERAGILCDRCASDDMRKAEQAALRSQVGELLTRSGVPDIPDVRLHPGVSRFLTSSGRGLFIHGVPGSYKTSNAVQLVREWCGLGKSAFYATERAYFTACWDKDRDTIRRMKTIPLLVLDDIGTDHQSDWSAGLFFDLVDARYQNRKLKTVFVSNHSLAELVGQSGPGFKHFDDRVFRRVSELCGEPILMMRG